MSCHIILCRCLIKHLWKGKETKSGWLVVGIKNDKDDDKKEYKILKEWVDEDEDEESNLVNIKLDRSLKRCIFVFKARNEPREIDFDCLISTEGYTKKGEKEKEKDEEANAHLKSKEGISKRDIFPRGKPRIIIFIDDLDRTDPDRILDVLEAMQLLVSTPLFVIIAAIDARYVCLSLENKARYDKILRSHQSPTGIDFLEKIFQVTYRLPTITEDKMDVLIRNLIDIEDEEIKPSKSNQEPSNLAQDDNFNEDDGGGNDGDGGESEPVPEQKFTRKESKMLRDACKAFKLLPRTVKRVVNVFKIMKMIWYCEGKKGGSEDLKRYSLLLLVMAASDKTRDGMQVIFNLMEDREVPSKAHTHFLGLLKEHCPVLKNVGEDDSLLINGLDGIEYAINTEEKWVKVSEKFSLARSFSFYRTVEKDDLARSSAETTKQPEDSRYNNFLKLFENKQ